MNSNLFELACGSEVLNVVDDIHALAACFGLFSLLHFGR